MAYPCALCEKYTTVRSEFKWGDRVYLYGACGDHERYLPLMIFDYIHKIEHDKVLKVLYLDYISNM